jgi:hypothetical protein
VWLAKELKSDPKDKTQPKDGAKAKNQADDKIESRKRTSSSIAVADRPKKAKETPAGEFLFQLFQQTTIDIIFRQKR